MLTCSQLLVWLPQCLHADMLTCSFGIIQKTNLSPREQRWLISKAAGTMEEAPWDPLKLWCGNLRSDVAAGEILAAFEEEGVWGITSVYPFPRGERDACAFLTFENTQQARFAIAQLNGWAIPAVSSGIQGLAIRFTNAPAGKGKGKSKAKNMYSYENMVDHGAHGHMLSEPPVAEVEVASPDQGKPRALMEAELGTKERFDQALADGDIVEIIIIDKGKKFYQYRELEVAHIKGKKKEGKTKRDMPMTDEQEKEWNDCLEALNWNFEASDAVEENLALGDVPKKVTKAMDKAYKQIMEQVKKSQKLCDAFKGKGSSLGSSGMSMVDKLKSALVDTKTSGHTLDTFITMGVDESKGTLTVSAVKGKLNEAAVHLKELLTQTKFCKTLLSK